MTLSDELARMKAVEQKELDQAISRHQQDFETCDQRRCPWCPYTWSTVKGSWARGTIWIPEANHYGHLRCWQRHKEAQAK